MNIESFDVSVRLPSKDLVTVNVSSAMSVLDLKETLRDHGVDPSRVRVVFRGAVLADHFSLGHYKVARAATLFLVEQKVALEPRKRACDLFDDLVELLYRLLFASVARQDSLLRSITALLENPYLRSYARVNGEAQKLIEEAVFIIENSHDATGARVADFIARTNDATITKLEATREGMLALRNLFLRDEEETQRPVQKTKVDFESVISCEPLPFAVSPQRVLPQEPLCDDPVMDQFMYVKKSFNVRFVKMLKGRFAREIRDLKKKGLDDEVVLFQALSEANGNLSRTEKILKTRFSAE